MLGYTSSVCSVKPCSASGLSNLLSHHRGRLRTFVNQPRGVLDIFQGLLDILLLRFSSNSIATSTRGRGVTVETMPSWPADGKTELPLQMKDLIGKGYARRGQVGLRKQKQVEAPKYADMPDCSPFSEKCVSLPTCAHLHKSTQTAKKTNMSPLTLQIEDGLREQRNHVKDLGMCIPWTICILPHRPLGNDESVLDRV